MKNLLLALGFSPKENTQDIYSKKYPLCGGYEISVDYKNEKIDYGDTIGGGRATTANFSQDENWVVLECVDRLLSKGYKPEDIFLEKKFTVGHGAAGGWLDIFVKKDGKAYLMIECKTWGKEFDREWQNTQKKGGQLLSYLQQDRDTEFLVLYASQLDGKKVIYKNEIIKVEEDYRQMASNIEDLYNRWNKFSKQNGIFESWARAYHFESKALTLSDLKEIRQEDSSFIFNQFLEILRHNTVSDKGNAFNRIFTLFLCKVYDEKTAKVGDELKFQWLEGIDTHISFQIRLTDLYKNGMLEFLSKQVTDFSEDDFEKKYKHLDDSVKKSLLEDFFRVRLEKNNEFAIKDVFDHQSFEDNAKVVKEVVELLQKYRIRYNKRQQYLSDFFELLLTTGLKQESGQFFTPVPVAQFIIKSLPIDQIIHEKIEKGEKNNLLPYIIDYAAGSGHFLTESMHEVQGIINQKNPRDFIEDTGKKLKSWQEDHFDWATQYVYGIEKDYRLVKVGKVGCYLHGDGLANVILSDGLARFSHKEYKGKLSETDPTFPQDNKQFDILISNPPYSVSSFANTSGKYYTAEDFITYSKLTESSSEIECLFIERMKQLLKDGGIAGIILPSSILSNSGIYTRSREMILEFFDIIAITELGSNTFMATGTNTVVLFLRRKNNYESINLRQSIDKFVTTMNDVTINGIEHPTTKYVSHVWSGVTLDDYKTLLQKSPNTAIEGHEIYREYQKKILKKSQKEFFDRVIEIEKEKLYYFVLAYPQKIVLVKSGEKDAEKKFLGYEFSNRRGSEGIHPLQKGKSIDECTQMFDSESFENPHKASTYIYKAFTGDYEFPIAESMQKNISRHSLIDMLTFDRVEFEKNISLSIKKKIKIESKWETVKLANILDVLDSGKRPRGGVAEYRDGVPSLGGEHIGLDGKISCEKMKFVPLEFFQNSRQGILEDNDILICKDGALTGKVAFFQKNDLPYLQSMINEHVFILRLGARGIQKYLFAFLYSNQGQNLLKSNITGQAQGGLNRENLLNIQIPLPPLDIQEQIVKEIETIEKREIKIKNGVEEKRGYIAKLMGSMNGRDEKLENIAVLLKRGKSAKYGDSNIQIIKSGQARGLKEFDFRERHFVAQGFTLDERQLQRGDILINSTGVGTAGRITLFDLEGDFVVDTHVTILRLDRDKALPDFVLQSLVKIGFKNIEAMATGQSGQIELSLGIIGNIKISLPPLSEQQRIVTEIEKIEDEISRLESELTTIPSQKEFILKKYLA